MAKYIINIGKRQTPNEEKWVQQIQQRANFSLLHLKMKGEKRSVLQINYKMMNNSVEKQVEHKYTTHRKRNNKLINTRKKCLTSLTKYILKKWDGIFTY